LPFSLAFSIVACFTASNSDILILIRSLPNFKSLCASL